MQAVMALGSTGISEHLLLYNAISTKISSARSNIIFIMKEWNTLYIYYTKTKNYLLLNPFPHRDFLMLLQTEQAQIRQLLQELPDQGLLCLLMEKWYI